MEFCLLLRLKYLSFTSGNKDIYDVYFGRLKSNLYINDNRTMKKCLNNIHKQGYINEDVDVQRKKPVQIKLNMELLNEKPFSQLPTTLLDQIQEIDYVGIRLLYYYESYINRSSGNQFCFPSVETIVNDTGISKNTVTKYNEILKNKQMLRIVKHQLSTEYDYKDNDELIFDKYNNHYYVKVNNM
jgi:hypothetical protein